VSYLIDAMARAMTHRLGELDRHILDSHHQVEVEELWRTRRKLVLMFRRLLGKQPPNPGK
jgi:hypothetical protein